MLQIEWTLHSKANSKWPWPPPPPMHICTHAHKYMHKHTYLSALTTCAHTDWNTPLALLYPQILPSVQFFLPSLLASSLAAVMKGAGRLSRARIAFWFPQSLLSGSRQDSSLIVTTGAVLRIRGAHRHWWGPRLRPGVGEYTRGIGRVWNKGASGVEGVGEVVWIEGGPMDEIGLAEKSPPETGGVANLDRGIKEVKSGSGGRDFGIGIRAGRWQTEPENRTKPSLFCLHPALVKHLEDCIRKHRRRLMGQNTSLNAWRDIYPEYKWGWYNIMKNFWFGSKMWHLKKI